LEGANKDANGYSGHDVVPMLQNVFRKWKNGEIKADVDNGDNNGDDDEEQEPDNLVIDKSLRKLTFVKKGERRISSVA
jgi:hypothetical protein